MVSPKTSEELRFLIDLFEQLGISAFVMSEEEEESFLLRYEVSEAGKAFLEQRAQAKICNFERQK